MEKFLSTSTFFISVTIQKNQRILIQSIKKLLEK